MKTHLCTSMSESETTSDSKLESDKTQRSWKAMRKLGKGHFHFGLGQFLALKG